MPRETWSATTDRQEAPDCVSGHSPAERYSVAAAAPGEPIRVTGRVWKFVSDLMKDPEQLREDLEMMIELENRASRTNPELETKAWLDKLAEADAECRSYIKLAAKGHISETELERELVELEETREIVQSELSVIQNR